MVADKPDITRFKGSVRLSFTITMLVLGVCCVALTVGYSWNQKRWGPWLMLLAVIGLLALMLQGIMSLMGM